MQCLDVRLVKWWTIFWGISSSTWISASVKSVDWFWSFLWVGQTTTSMPFSSKKCWHIWHIPAKYGSRLPYTEEHMVLCTSRWPNWWMALPCKRMAHLWTSCHSHEVCISQFCQKDAYMWPVGGHFVALKQRSFSSSFHKRRAPSTSPGEQACLLIFSPCSWHCTETHWTFYRNNFYRNNFSSNFNNFSMQNYSLTGAVLLISTSLPDLHNSRWTDRQSLLLPGHGDIRL